MELLASWAHFTLAAHQMRQSAGAKEPFDSSTARLGEGVQRGHVDEDGVGAPEAVQLAVLGDEDRVRGRDEAHEPLQEG